MLMFAAVLTVMFGAAWCWVVVRGPIELRREDTRAGAAVDAEAGADRAEGERLELAA